MFSIHNCLYVFVIKVTVSLANETKFFLIPDDICCLFAGKSGLTFEEFQTVFLDYLKEHYKVPDRLSKTLSDLFDGPVSKVR